MTKSTITRDRLAEIAQFGFSSGITPANDFEIKELARLALAAMDSKPVFFIEVEGDDWINAGRIEGKNRPDLGLLPDGINYLYAAPRPLTDAEREELQERRKAAAKTITLPTPACTYADHSYPAYTKQQVLTMLESLGVTVVEEDV